MLILARGVLAPALLITYLTDGFGRVRVWERRAMGLLVLSGIAPAIPLLVLIGVLAFNAILIALPVVLAIADLGIWLPWLLIRGRRR